MKEPTQQFLSDVLVTAMEGGIDYWIEGVVRYKWMGEDGNELPFPIARVRVENARSGRVAELDITEDVLRRGLRRIDNGQVRVNAELRQGVIDAVNEDDAGRIDATLSDLIVQAGLLNEIVYG